MYFQLNDSFFVKHFKYLETTIANVDGFPIYRRRKTPPTIIYRRSKTAPYTMLEFQIDNRNVVPYNKFLTLKYNAHINIEICTSVKCVKYIYKYIYKGYDCASLEIKNNSLIHDECKSFADFRYISYIEAMWRLLEFKMHDRSHGVIRLAVHLPWQQQVLFMPKKEREAFEKASARHTTLTAWFELNRTNQHARQYLYHEIPYHFVFNDGQWQPRQKECKIVSRMYTVNATDIQRFALRLLLLHVPGATCFEDLLSYNGVTYDSFKNDAIARHLLLSDVEFGNCILEAAGYQMPAQLRQTFAFICAYCKPINVKDIWHRFANDMSADYQRSMCFERALNRTLFDIQQILHVHDLSCSFFGLPEPTAVLGKIKLPLICQVN